MRFLRATNSDPMKSSPIARGHGRGVESARHAVGAHRRDSKKRRDNIVLVIFFRPSVPFNSQEYTHCSVARRAHANTGCHWPFESGNESAPFRLCRDPARHGAHLRSTIHIWTKWRL